MLYLKYFPLPAALAILAFAFMVGACLGSFINCIEIRRRNKITLLGRSACPECGRKLGFFELVPVFSYLFLRGRCRGCKGRISPRYFTVEIACGTLWAFVVAVSDSPDLTPELLLLFTLLFAEALWDIDTFEVPDLLHVLCAANFLVFLPLHQHPLNRLIQGVAAGLVYGGGILIISLIFDKVYKKDSIGGADIKLIAVLGLYFGFKVMLLLIILSCFVGGVMSLIFKAGLQKQFPFIPALCISALVCAFWGESFISWYLSLFIIERHVH